MAIYEVIRELVRISKSPGGLSLLSSVLKLIRSFKGRGYGNTEIRLKIESITDQVAKSDNKDRDLLDLLFPPKPNP